MLPTTQLKAIRLKCLDCSSNQAAEVRECPITQCPLYAWRFGKHPKTVAKAAQKKNQK